MFTTRARVGYSSGSSKIYPWKNFAPVIVGHETMFRGRMTTTGEFVSARGHTDDESDPIMRKEDETHWIVDFPAHRLPWAAHPTEDPVAYVVEDAEGRGYSRNVHIVVELSSLGITSDAADVAWPAPTCTAQVSACVEGLGQSADLEACGSVARVRPCLDEVPYDNTETLKSAFATGLR
ncbi:MAG: hypothetical protein ACNA8W_22395, partial [Bradymonadaceae bacterium]